MYGGDILLSREALVCLIFCPAFFTFITLSTAIQYLFELGKSNSRIKKEKAAIPLIKKLLLKEYAEKCRYHISTAKTLCRLYWAYLFLLFLCIVLWMLSAAAAKFAPVFTVVVLTKLMFDIGINLYGFAMSRWDRKHGGVTYKWRAE